MRCFSLCRLLPPLRYIARAEMMVKRRSSVITPAAAAAAAAGAAIRRRCWTGVEHRHSYMISIFL